MKRLFTLFSGPRSGYYKIYCNEISSESGQFCPTILNFFNLPRDPCPILLDIVEGSEFILQKSEIFFWEDTKATLNGGAKVEEIKVKRSKFAYTLNGDVLPSHEFGYGVTSLIDTIINRFGKNNELKFGVYYY